MTIKPSCYDCIFCVDEYKFSYCGENNKIILDDTEFVPIEDTDICEKFRTRDEKMDAIYTLTKRMQELEEKINDYEKKLLNKNATE